MSDTSRRCVLNNAFQVLKPPCLQRVRCFAVVAAVFFIRGILNDPWLLGRPWRQESWGPIAVATNWCQWERALGLGLWGLGLGLGLRGLRLGLWGGNSDWPCIDMYRYVSCSIEKLRYSRMY